MLFFQLLPADFVQGLFSHFLERKYYAMYREIRGLKMLDEFCEDEDACDRAAELGHIKILRWFTQRNYPWSEATIEAAAAENQIEIVKWLFDSGCPYDDNLYYQAASKGHFELLKWVMKNVKDRAGEDAAGYWAVVTGSIEIMEWIHENGFLLEDQASSCEAAAEEGHLELLKWLHGKGCDFYRSAESAARNGHIETCFWILETMEPDEHDDNGDLCAYLAGYKLGEDNLAFSLIERATALGCEITAKTLAIAASFGRITLLEKLAHKFNIAWNMQVSAFAALGGQIETLIWLRQHGCPITSHTFDSAAQNGHIDTLNWLKENNYPATTTIYQKACENGQFHVVEWAFRNKYRSDHIRINTLIEAEPRTIEILIQVGAIPNLSNELITFIKRSDISLIKWFAEKGYRFDTDSCYIAAKYGRLATLIWLLDQGYSWNWTLPDDRRHSSEMKAFVRNELMKMKNKNSKYKIALEMR